MLQTKKRDVSIDLLRGFAALCVILGHSFIVHPVNVMVVPWCKAVHDFIYTFHMELFFALAGWVWHCSHYKKYITGKIVHIWIPYLVFGIASIVLHTVGGSLVNGSVSLKEGIASLLLYGGDYWFLYTIFIVYAIYPFLNKVANNTRIKIFVLAVLLVIKSFCKLPDLLTLNAVVEYLPYFILGNITRSYLTESRKAFVIRYWWQISVVGIGVYAGLNVVIGLFTLESCVVLTYIRAVAMCTVLYVLANLSVAMLEKFGGVLYRLYLPTAADTRFNCTSLTGTY